MKLYKEGKLKPVIHKANIESGSNPGLGEESEEEFDGEDRNKGYMMPIGEELEENKLPGDRALGAEKATIDPEKIPVAKPISEGGVINSEMFMEKLGSKLAESMNAKREIPISGGNAADANKLK